MFISKSSHSKRHLKRLILLLKLLTHIIKVDHEGNIASNGRTELCLAGGQAEASGWSGTTRLPPGGVHVLSSLLAVIRQNLPIPLQHQKLEKRVLMIIFVEYQSNHV